jgi:septum formation protein
VLVLASNSPRRHEILSAAGIPFIVRAPDVPEEARPGESAIDYVRRLAEAKAFAVALSAGEIALGADTVVVVDQQILEKPSSADDALRMLRLLSGREHEVITGICLRTESRKIVDVASTKVRFVELSEQEMIEYVRSGEPMDKAGAYAIQGLASKFIDRVEGCYFNVVGLPVALLYRHLQSLLWDPLAKS